MTPTAIKLHKRSKLLEVSYSESQSFQLEAELLRVYSPLPRCAATAVGRKCCKLANARLR